MSETIDRLFAETTKLLDQWCQCGYRRRDHIGFDRCPTAVEVAYPFRDRWETERAYMYRLQAAAANITTFTYSKGLNS